MPRVRFLPAGKSLEVGPGTSLLEAARLCGVRIRNDCGGQGACGRCIVRVLSGTGVQLSARHKLRSGEVLACRYLALESDVLVFVPRTSQEVTEDVVVRKAARVPEEFPPPGALVKRVPLELRPPSLEDNASDHDRLMRALNAWRTGAYTLPLEVLRNLPRGLRDAGWRADVTVAVDGQRAAILEVSPPAPMRPCIVAVDVGTTALKADLLAPRQTWAASCYNSQVTCGPDVISRILYCQQHKDGLQRMQRMVVRDTNLLVAALLQAAGLAREDVAAVVASGNTTMIHFLLGLEPLWIRREPYVGCSYHPAPVRASDVGLSIHPRGLLYCLPSVSAYVGGDITGGVLASGLWEQARPHVLIDLGTNGEIVIGDREFMACCSASAGPAFEGEASASGTRARPGAIETVYFSNGLRWKTIEGQPPVGICGSGYIDLLAALLQQGLIDRTGKFQDGTCSCLRQAEHGTLECVVVEAEDAAGDEDIVLTQADVDNLVRAKGAIYAASSVLLRNLGMDWNDIDQIMLAGAFGDKINLENAVRIGLLPDVSRRRIKFVGNTSLKGAVKVALSEADCARVHDIARRMTYFELSTHPHYMEEFVAACFLPHTDTDRFPSVRQFVGN